MSEYDPQKDTSTDIIALGRALIDKGVLTFEELQSHKDAATKAYREVESYLSKRSEEVLCVSEEEALAVLSSAQGALTEYLTAFLKYGYNGPVEDTPYGTH